VNFKKYIAEIKRRNVFKPAITYLIGAWLIAQVSDVVLPTFNAPPHFMKTLIIILIIGFPLILILAWIYELTPQGIKKTKHIEAGTSISAQTIDRLNNNNKKLVVLPFQDISSNKGNNYFSNGLTEEIIIRLSGIEGLDIASRSTSMRYRDSELDNESLGRELNARYLLQGTVRRIVRFGPIFIKAI
jgi:adenylate cyclase